MGIEIQIILMVGYNLLLIELLMISWMSWRYNGHATTGTGKLLGPFAFILASVLMRINISMLLAALNVNVTEDLVWRIAGIAQLWGAVVIGGFVCEHMVGRVRRERQKGVLQ